MLLITFIQQSAGFSAASDATRVSILLGLVKVDIFNIDTEACLPFGVVAEHVLLLEIIYQFQSGVNNQLVSLHE